MKFFSNGLKIFLNGAKNKKEAISNWLLLDDYFIIIINELLIDLLVQNRY